MIAPSPDDFYLMRSHTSYFTSRRYNKQSLSALTSVLLESHSILKVVLSGRLCGASEERPHHYRRGSKGERLDTVPHVLDPTVSDDRDAEATGVLGHFVDGRTLRPPHGQHLLQWMRKYQRGFETQLVNFSQHFFSERKKKTLDYSLWFLSNLMK